MSQHAEEGDKVIQQAAQAYAVAAPRCLKQRDAPEGQISDDQHFLGKADFKQQSCKHIMSLLQKRDLANKEVDEAIGVASQENDLW